jgi:cytochrome c oxidase subunit II
VNGFLRRILFLPRQMSTIAYDLDQLHYFVILTTMAGAVLVTLVGGYFLIRYRRRDLTTHGANPDSRVKPPVLLKLSALVGLAVLFLTFWVLGLREFIRIRVVPDGAMVVYVTAKQWMWKFAYPRGARSIARLYVPAGRPVKLVMTSRDVIHSFFVPEFRVKQDVVPGRYTTLWFEAVAPGTYPILCTQYCGTGHSTMRAEVVAMPPDDFERWLAGQDPAAARLAGPSYVPPQLGLADAAPAQQLSMVRQGVQVAAAKGCLRCHTLDGSPYTGPTWAGLYDAVVPLEDGKEVVADVAYLTESMMDPMVKIHRGYGPVMPSYLGRLEPGEVAAIVELIKSLRAVRVAPDAEVPPPAGLDGGARLPAAGPPLEDDDQEGRGLRHLPPQPEPPGGEITQ